MKVSCFFILFFISIGLNAQNEFIIVVNTNPDVLLPEYSSTTTSEFILPLRENSVAYEIEYQKVDSISLNPETLYSPSITIVQNTNKYLISFPEPGFYRIKITSPNDNFIRWSNELLDFVNDTPNSASSDLSYQQDKLFRIEQWGNLKWTNFYFAFRSCDLSNVNDCFGMFLSCSNLIYNSSINNWNVSNVTDMTAMFVSCELFNQPLNDWDVSNVVSMENMFSHNFLFNQPLNNWNVGNVNNFNEMFLWAINFNQPLDQWIVSKAFDMSSMFNNATLFNQSLGTWDLPEGVNLNAFLSSSGMGCSNYYETLNGWASNPLIPNNMNVGVEYLQYAENTILPRDILINDKNWSFYGDVFSETNCLLNNSNFEFNKVIVFPNPTSDFLYVESSSDFIKYEIFDSVGRKITSNNFETQISIQTLIQGNYILKLFTKDNQNYSTKFIKK